MENKDLTAIRQNIGTNIRYFRKKYNFTIEEFSEIVNIASGFLGLIERGKRGTNLENLCKIANLFNITLDDMITKDLSAEAEETKETTCNKNYRISSMFINNLNNKEEQFVFDVIKSYLKLKRELKI